MTLDAKDGLRKMLSTALYGDHRAILTAALAEIEWLQTEKEMLRKAHQFGTSPPRLLAWETVMKRAMSIRSRRFKPIRMDAGTVRRLRNGQYEIDCKDSEGKRVRRGSFQTKEEAVAELQRIGVTKSYRRRVSAERREYHVQASDADGFHHVLAARDTEIERLQSENERLRGHIYASDRPSLESVDKLRNEIEHLKAELVKRTKKREPNPDDYPPGWTLGLDHKRGTP